MAVEQDVVRVARTFSAPPSALYRAWLDPQLVRQWMAPPGQEVTHAEVDERVGGRHRVWQGHGGGFDSEIVQLSTGRIPDPESVTGPPAE